MTTHWPRLFVLLLLGCLCGSAQQPRNLHLRGIVHDSHSKLEVASARVSVVGGRAKQDSRTDSKGYFDLPLMPDVQPGEEVTVRVEKEGYRPYEEAASVGDVPLQIGITPVSPATRKPLQKRGEGTATAAPANPKDSPGQKGLSDKVNIDAYPTVEVGRRLPTIEFSFLTSGDKRQQIKLSVVPELIQLEPKPTGVQEDDLPMDVPVTGGTLTVLRFGKEADHGYVLFDTRELPKGTIVRGEVIGYKEMTPSTGARSQAATENDNAQVSGDVQAGPCSNIQVGGSNNQATTNCVPPDRQLTDSQRSVVHDFLLSIPSSVKVFVKTIGDNGEAQRYAQQFQDEAVACGRSGNPRQVILGLFWHPVPVGLIIATHSDEDAASIYRDKLVQTLSLMNIEAENKVGDWIESGQLYIVVGERKPQ